MFSMRPAVAADEAAITDVIQRRAEWMRATGLPAWEGWHSQAESLAEQASNPHFPVWAMIDHSENQRVMGVTSVYDKASPLLWPDDPDPSLFLATTVTDPDYRRQQPGRLIAWWTLDYAAQHDYVWVRRGTGPYPRLVAYYRDVQGWTVSATVKHQGVTAYGLQRAAEPQPDLPRLGMQPA
ncbi:hypothetical protein [Nonomuraea endophytica]|uniref:hypothetical protein n=1 Tax=Nonomuraea endophytica TaxID=714136 RepID=UPI0037C64885